MKKMEECTIETSMNINREIAVNYLFNDNVNLEDTIKKLKI